MIGINCIDSCSPPAQRHTSAAQVHTYAPAALPVQTPAPASPSVQKQLKSAPTGPDLCARGRWTKPAGMAPCSMHSLSPIQRTACAPFNAQRLLFSAEERLALGRQAAHGCMAASLLAGVRCLEEPSFAARLQAACTGSNGASCTGGPVAQKQGSKAPNTGNALHAAAHAVHRLAFAPAAAAASRWRSIQRF